MTGGRADIRIITYNSAEYVRSSLPLLLGTCRENDRVWLWHNGNDEKTLEVTRSYASDPRVSRFHHSRENVRLRPPTNWMWSKSSADFVSKVDDDYIISNGRLDTFEDACTANPGFGVVGNWRHPLEDLVLSRARNKAACYFHSDADLLKRLPLSAQRNGIRTRADWEDQIRRSATVAQPASLDLRPYSGWRKTVRSGRRRILRAIGRKAQW